MATASAEGRAVLEVRVLKPNGEKSFLIFVMMAR
jgi:hypothetical protein